MAAAIFIGFSAGGTLGAMLTGVFTTRAVNDGLKDASGAPLPLGLVDGNPAQILNQADAMHAEGVQGVVIARLMLDDGDRQIADHAAAVLITWALAALGTLIILKVVDLLIGLRVPSADEVQGLDITQHGEQGYIMEETYAPTGTLPG